MRLLEILRQKTFWAIDTMKGSPIGRQLADVESIMSANAACEWGGGKSF